MIHPWVLDSCPPPETRFFPLPLTLPFLLLLLAAGPLAGEPSVHWSQRWGSSRVTDIDPGAASAVLLDPSDDSPLLVGGVMSQVFVTHYSPQGSLLSRRILGSPYSSNSLPTSILSRFSPALGELEVVAPVAENSGFLGASLSSQAGLLREANLAIPSDATLFASHAIDPRGRLLVGWQTVPASGLGIDLTIGVVETNFSIGNLHILHANASVLGPQLAFGEGEELVATSVTTGAAASGRVEILWHSPSGTRSNGIPFTSIPSLLSADANGGGLLHSVARLGYGLLQWDRQGSLVASNYWAVDGAVGLKLAPAPDGGRFLLASLPGSVTGERRLLLSRIGPAGEILWSDTFGPFGFTQGATIPAAIAVRGTGESLVGFSGTTGFVAVAHSPLGVPSWTYSDPSTRWAVTTTPNDRWIVPDGAGNWYCVSQTLGAQPDQVPRFVKLSPDGVLLWARSDKPVLGSRETPSAILKTSDGALVVAGESIANTVAGGRADDYPGATIIRFDSGGAALWTNSLPSGARLSLAGGPAGESYLCGASVEAPFTQWKCFALAYSAAGAPIWTRTVSPGGSYPPAPVFGGADPEGNLIVGSGGGSGIFFTAKYTPSGDLAWTNSFLGVGSGGRDEPMAMAVGPGGDVYRTGVGADSSGNAQQMNLRISNGGKLLWSKRTAPPLQTYAAAVDPSGGLFFVGETFSTTLPGTLDGFLRRVTPTGENLPLLLYDDPAHGSDRFTSVLADSDGGVCVAGSRSGLPPSAASDVVIRYSPAGIPLWTNFFSAAPFTHAHVRRLVSDPDGGYFVTGEVHAEPGSVGPQSVILTRRLSRDGAELWHHLYLAPGDFEYRVQDMVIGPSGFPVIAGSVARPTGGADWLIYEVGEAPLTGRLEPGGWSLQTLGEAGVAYEAQRAATIEGPWLTLALVVATPSGHLRVLDTTPLPVQAFYRFVRH